MAVGKTTTGCMQPVSMILNCTKCNAEVERQFRIDNAKCFDCKEKEKREQSKKQVRKPKPYSPVFMEEARRRANKTTN